MLRCAGKVASDLTGNRLFISDSSNNRIVVTDLSGRFLEHVGCGAAGLVDGGYEEAAFYRPQGVAYSPKVRGSGQGWQRNLSAGPSWVAEAFRGPPKTSSSWQDSANSCQAPA